MKRIIAGILALGAMLALGGCGERLEPFDPKAIADEEFDIYLNGHVERVLDEEHWGADTINDGFYMYIASSEQDNFMSDTAEDPAKAARIAKANTLNMRMLLMNAKRAETRRGIHVGSTMNEVFNAYGWGTSIYGYDRDMVSSLREVKRHEMSAGTFRAKMDFNKISRGMICLEKVINHETGEVFSEVLEATERYPEATMEYHRLMIILDKQKGEPLPVVTSLDWIVITEKRKF